MKPPYEELAKDKKYLEKINNSFFKKVLQGSVFRLSPTAIVEIPDRKLLRTNIEDRYGIKNIDDYFIPIIVNKDTYWALSTDEAPSLFSGSLDDYLIDRMCMKGHVYFHDGYFISYISTMIETDMAIEHEGIHAYIMKHSSEYRNIPGYTFRSLFNPLSPKKESWLEAISFVMTLDTIDVTNLFSPYAVSQKKEIFSHKLSSTVLKTKDIASVSFQELKNSFKEKDTNRKYRLMRYATLQMLVLKQLFVTSNDNTTIWKDSFMSIKKMKQEYGIKDSLKKLIAHPREYWVSKMKDVELKTNVVK